MGIQDLIVTPLYFVIFFIVAFFVRRHFTDLPTRKYFLWALLVRFLGAIGLGIVYQFYYESGDTFIYWRHGSQWVWKAFLEDPNIGLQLIFDSPFGFNPELYQYSKHIWYYGDSASYFIVRLAGFFDLLTFGTYSSTALLFAIFSFSGAWAMFCATQKKYPHRTKWLAFGILFFPSVVFWGSGILKDSITLGALGWMVWSLLRWFDFKQRGWREVVVFVLSFWIILTVKIYILICFIPVVFVWLMLQLIKKIPNLAGRFVIAPLVALITVSFGYFIVNEISQVDSRYALSNIAESARITAYDIRYGWGARTASGGGYDIGLPDGTIVGTVSLLPKAINVTLFRPYLWEVNNPLMFLSALEALIILFFTFKFLTSRRTSELINDPFLLMCLLFSLLFAFAIGVSTFNFGTLMRYKIPLLPFFLIAIGILQKQSRGRFKTYPIKTPKHNIRSELS